MNKATYFIDGGELFFVLFLVLVSGEFPVSTFEISWRLKINMLSNKVRKLNFGVSYILTIQIV